MAKWRSLLISLFVNQHVCWALQTPRLGRDSSIIAKCRSTGPAFHSVPPLLEETEFVTRDDVETLGKPIEEQAEQAVGTLASTLLAMLAGNEESAQVLAGGAAKKQKMIRDAFEAYDICASGTLSREEAEAFFTNLAISIVTELARDPEDDTKASKNNVSRAHARRVLAKNEAGDTIARVAKKLLLMADEDGDGRISLAELGEMFETVHQASHNPDVFPRPLRALAGSLQLLPPTGGRSSVAEASSLTSQWHLGVPGDDHTLRQVAIDGGKLTLVGLGRSADASAYFLPELSIVLDAGIHVKSLQPKTVLLTHGHRDHIAALPTHAASGAKICTPKAIAPLVKRFLLAEAQLNYGDVTQTDQETIAALGEFDIEAVDDCREILLPKSAYTGSPTPLGIQVVTAPHKSGVPAVSYGIYRVKNRLKEEFATLPKNELGQLLRNNVTITESYNEGVLFYTGDTTIKLLQERWQEILPKYKSIIHEVTFLGMPSEDLDKATLQKGHTHYAQLHPWVCAFPDTTFICAHWSLRYSKEEILDFFQEQYGGVPKNVVLWV